LKNLYLLLAPSEHSNLNVDSSFFIHHPWIHSQSPSIPTSALKKSYSLSLSLCDFSFSLSEFSIFKLFRFVSNLSGSSMLEIAALLTNTTVSPLLILFHIPIYVYIPFIFLFLRFQILILLRHSFSSNRLLCNSLLCNFSI